MAAALRRVAARQHRKPEAALAVRDQRDLVDLQPANSDAQPPTPLRRRLARLGERGDGAGDSGYGLLIMRNMLVSPNFAPRQSRGC